MEFSLNEKTTRDEKDASNQQKEAVMKNLTQKAAIIFVVFVFSLIVSGSAVFAQDHKTGSLIAAADLTFVESASEGSTTPAVTESRTELDVPEAGGLVTGVDLSFIKTHPKASYKTTGHHETDHSVEGMGVITDDDYRYLIAGM